jgi:hypothetical protein
VQKFNLKKAEQTADLYWDVPGGDATGDRSFVSHIVQLHKVLDVKSGFSGDNKPCIYDSSKEQNTKSGSFLPIVINDSSYSLEYDGKSNMISDVMIDYSDNAGLFGSSLKSYGKRKRPKSPNSN